MNPIPVTARGFRPLMTLAALITALLAPALLRAQPATGSVEGRVFNATTVATLRNVRIALESPAGETPAATGNRAPTAFTNADGTFRLADLPAGPAHVSASYLGFESQTFSVNIPAGSSVTRDVDLSLPGSRKTSSSTGPASETVKLTELTVVADREMSAQAIAMNEQRNTPNIKRVVAVDEYGDRGDENIGEFLRFLPGVELNDSGQVPNGVTLRGFPATTSGVTIDGGDVLGARGGDTRAVSLLEVPMSNVSRVEVTKVPTPDMPASGLGGSLNIISKGGVESKKPAFSYQVYQLFHSRTGFTLDGGPRNHIDALSPKYVQPSFSFSYLHPVNKSLAFSAGGSRSWRQKPMERGKDSDETATWDLLNFFQRQSDWQSLVQILKTWSGQVGADWRITPRDMLSVSLQYRESDSYITRSTFSAVYGAGATGDARFTQGAATAVGSVSQSPTPSGTRLHNHARRQGRVLIIATTRPAALAIAGDSAAGKRVRRAPVFGDCSTG